MSGDGAVADQHRFFLELGDYLSVGEEIESRLQVVARALCEDLGYPVVMVWVRRGPCLELKAAAGIDAGKADKLRQRNKMVEGGGLVGRAVHMAETVYSADLPEEAPADRDPQMPDVRSQIAMPLIPGKDEVIGVLDVDAEHGGAFWPGDIAFLEAVAAQLAFAVQAAKTIGGGGQKVDATQVSATNLVAVARALEWSNPFFAGHSERVAWIAVQLGNAMGIKGKDAEHLETAALLHDLGMMGIPDTIISRKGKLKPEEQIIVRLHTVSSARLCRLLPEGEAVAPIVAAHHELLDGSGYPEGLSGDQIPLATRVITVADVYDALTSDRPYRAAFAFAEALEQMEEGEGRLFDTRVLEALSERAPQLEKTLAERSRFMPGCKDEDEPTDS